jgi:hypothetical protein
MINSRPFIEVHVLPNFADYCLYKIFDYDMVRNTPESHAVNLHIIIRSKMLHYNVIMNLFDHIKIN